MRSNTSGSISSGEISSLDHEVFDHPVELAAFITESFLLKRHGINPQISLQSMNAPVTHLSCGQLEEVLRGFGNGLSKESDDNPPSILISDPYVKVDLGKTQHLSLGTPGLRNDVIQNQVLK